MFCLTVLCDIKMHPKITLNILIKKFDKEQIYKIREHNINESLEYTNKKTDWEENTHTSKP